MATRNPPNRGLGTGNQTLLLTVSSPPLTINYLERVGFILIFNGDKNQAAVLEYTTDFLQCTPLATKAVGVKDLLYFDPLGANTPYRFYRVRKQ